VDSIFFIDSISYSRQDKY